MVLDGNRLLVTADVGVDERGATLRRAERLPLLVDDDEYGPAEFGRGGGVGGRFPRAEFGPPGLADLFDMLRLHFSDLSRHVFGLPETVRSARWRTLTSY